jgi:hypothetical protein
MQHSNLVRVGIGASLLFAAACAEGGDGAVDEAPSAPTVGDTAGAEPEAFGKLTLREHTISFYDEGDGVFGVAERGPIGEPSLLDRFPSGASPSEIFARLDAGPVPESVLEFERRHHIVSSLNLDDADAESAATETRDGFVVLKHEAGASHFTSSHCPPEPFPAVWSGFAEGFHRSSAQTNTNIVTRKFCWSAGHSGSWTESSTAAVMSNVVSAVSGSICFTRVKDTGSATWTILQGEQMTYNTFNRPAVWNPPCGGSACSSLYASVNAPLSASVGCANDAGDVWRWGGIFKKHSLTGFVRFY